MSIDLATPLPVTQSATKVKLQSVTFTPAQIVVTYVYTAADGSVQKTDTLYLSGADFQQVADFTIPQAWVGDKLLARIGQAVKTKLKTVLSLNGTVAGGF